jgi:hypothetical protein
MAAMALPQAMPDGRASGAVIKSVAVFADLDDVAAMGVAPSA